MKNNQPEFTRGLVRKVKDALKQAIARHGHHAFDEDRGYMVGIRGRPQFTISFNQGRYAIVGIRDGNETWAVCYEYQFSKGQLTLHYNSFANGHHALPWEELYFLGAVA